jgi:hypothetical protein
MKMALPRGMYPHPKTGVFWVRKDVPKELQGLIGKTSLKQTLGTKNADAARSQFHDVMKQFEDRIAAAKKSLANGTPMPFEPITIPIAPEHQAGFKALSLPKTPSGLD